MLKVGDKVRVRKDLSYGDYIQGFYVTREMMAKTGQVVTISKTFDNTIISELCYEIEELDTYGVAFTDDMFELDEIDEEDKNNANMD